MSNQDQHKAQWVADLMRADGVTADQLGALPTETQTSLIVGYMDAIGRKIEQIQATFLTRNGAKEVMARAVIAINKGAK